MSDWNPNKYLLFKDQRTQPAVDLAQKVKKICPQTIVDIGCGPGNSSEVLRSVFPDADIIGIDSSAGMIEKAQKEHNSIRFLICGAEELTGTYDLLFSNACLQWIPGHEELIPQLMLRLNPGGALAVQIPMNSEEPLFRIIKDTAAESKWDFETVHFEKNDVLSPKEYFDLLSRCSSNFEIWETVYYHAMPSHRQLIEWVKGTRLRPYLDVLNPAQQSEFENDILSKVKAAYPVMANNKVVLKFRRFFFIAEKL